MTNRCKNSIPLTTTILLFILVGLLSHGQQQQQHHLRFTVEAGESVCVEYDQTENTIHVNCNSSFSAVVQAINNPQIVEHLGDGEYLLNATLEVVDGVSFEMNSSNAGGIGDLQYLKIADENGIIVYGKILIDGVKITSWNSSSNDVISQDMNGSTRRGYIQFAASEGSRIINSEFGYLGDVEPGRRGFDFLGDGEEPSHDIVVRGSKFHDMWIALYDNTIERVSSYGIHLFNPDIPDDGGGTEGNLIYNNTIINSENGVVATRSQDNIVQNTTFYDIEESEYRLSGDSSIRIRGQHLDNPLISQNGSVTTIRH
jgi:parallel beta-helix repeat protein